MTNVTGLKKIISVALLGSLLVTGAVVYADTATADTALKAANAGLHMQMDRKGSPEASMLSKLVSEGAITAEEQATIERALLTQHTQIQADREAQDRSTVKPEAGTKPVSHFGKLAEAGLITQTLADKVDAYMTAQQEAAFAERVKPLVDNGTFTNAAAVKTAMDAVRDEMKTQMDANRPSDDSAKSDVQKTRPDFKTMTETGRTALKAEMEAKRTEMEAKRTQMEAQHEAAITKVYSDLVSNGILNQAQADALKTLKGLEMGPMDGARDFGRGQGHGPGEMGMGPVTPTDTATAEQ